MSNCDYCVYAVWEKTTNGRLHPNKSGRCVFLEKHPLDLRLPTAFYWTGPNLHEPDPSGGFIERHGKENNCIFKTTKRP